MHGPKFAVIAAAFWLGIASTGAIAGHESVDRARAYLAKDDPRSAIMVLEPALATAGADLGPMIVVLRQAYTHAAAAAVKAGRSDEAEEYRENLLILNRKMRARPDEASSVTEPTKPTADPPVPIEAPATSPMPPAPMAREGDRPVTVENPPPLATNPPTTIPEIQSSTIPDKATPGPSEIPPLTLDQDEPPPRPTPETPRESRPTAAISQLPPAETTPSLTDPMVAPASTDANPADRNAAILAAADRDYLAEKYLDASRGYAELASSGALPEERRLHWAYCRSVDVVRRIRAKPTTAAEWEGIDREIVEIKSLSPKYWYAEYLRNRAADQSRNIPRSPRGRVVRGAMPEAEGIASTSPATIRDLTRKAPPAPAQPPVGKLPRPSTGAIAMAIPSTDTPPAVSTRGDSDNWQLKETDNFAIYHADPAMAEEVARVAEATRDAITRRWSGSPAPRPWTPKCEIYLYPTSEIFAQVTGQPAESPGFSTMEASGGRVTVRRVKLRADHPTLVSAVLPHEVTHVILADLFPVEQVPRWADEGMAVLSEPAGEQDNRLTDLAPVLQGGRIFSVENLMVRDYPEGQYWALYYAQSVSLTKFLVDRGGHARLVEFLHAVQNSRDIPSELKRVYQIDGYAELQALWLDYARSSTRGRVAAADDPNRVR